jgi:hypothetical protein
MAHTKHRRHARHASKHTHHSHKPTQQLGSSPTNSQKLIYVANKLGLPGIAEMQGSTVNLYDTIALNSSAGSQTFNFFTQTNNKSNNLSNFQNGSLKAGEAMILERAVFFLVNLTAADLGADTTAISDVYPIGELVDGTTFIAAGKGQVEFPGSLKTARMQVNIANQTVVKSFSLFEQIPQFNPLTSGVANSIVSVAALPAEMLGTQGQNVVPLESPPVLPPNQSLDVSFTFGAVGTVTPAQDGGQWAIMCIMGRFGCIFASKTTL